MVSQVRSLLFNNIVSKPKIIIASLSGGSLTLQGLTRGNAEAIEFGITLAILSEQLDFLDVRVFAVVFQWLLFTYTMYVFIIQYSNRSRSYIIEEYIFLRIFIPVSAAAIGITIVYFSQPKQGFESVLPGIPLVIFIYIIVQLYVYYIWANNSSEKEEIIKDMTRMFDQEIEENLWDVALVGGSLTITVMIVIFGCVTSALNTISPIPELLLLTSVISSYVLPGEFYQKKINIDIDEKMQKSIIYIIKSNDVYMIMVLFAATGLAILFVNMTLQEFGEGVKYDTYYTELPIIQIWVELGSKILLLLPAFYCLWFWISEINRLPRYIYIRLPESIDQNSSEHSPTLKRTVRPIGNMLPLLIASPVAFFIPLKLDKLSLLSRIGYSVLWPILLFIFALIVIKSYTRKHPTTLNEKPHILFAIIIQSALILLFSNIFDRPLPFQSNMFYFSVFGLVWLLFYNNILEYSEYSNGIKQYSLVFYLMIFSLISFLLSVPVMALFGLVGSIGLAYRNYIME